MVCKSSLHLRAAVELEERAVCLLGPWQPLETVSSIFLTKGGQTQALKYFVLHLNVHIKNNMLLDRS